MKIEIDIDDAKIRLAVNSAAQKVLSNDRYSGFSGYMADELVSTICAKVEAEISKLDFQAIINDVIESNLVPTVRELIQSELKAEAKKAVKAAMLERSA